MRWLYRLEYKFGKYYIPHLIRIMVFGMAIVYLADMLLPSLNLIAWLYFDRALILQGQVWRVLTFLFVPTGNSIFFLITLYFYYILGNTLESYWGGFRLNVYYLIGALGAIAAGFIAGVGSNVYLNMSLFLAVAAIAPDQRVMLFFLIPVKFKWMAAIYAVLMVFDVINAFLVSAAAGLIALVSLAFSLAAYLIFFGPSLVTMLRDQLRVWNNRRNWRGR